MCGIYGSLRFEPDPDRLSRVAHRGPDGHGWKVIDTPAGALAMGHRRLAIIDTSESALQPMHDSQKRFTLIFNGEIYNYKELAQELKAIGKSFRTHSDTEVLLTAYEVWGEACLERLRGMFAFLIHDLERQTLFAARDRFGIKPLYMVANAYGVAFASEIKQLIGLPGLTGRMNHARVHDFLLAGISDHTDETLFEGIMQLGAGMCLSLSTHTTGALSPALRRWYTPTDQLISLNAQEAAERFGALLHDSVKLHLRADVPVGSCLSGGLDSSALVCLMTQELAVLEGGEKRVHTLSACYPNKEVDEKPFMDAVIHATNAQPHWVFPNSDDVMQTAQRITWHQDEPFGSTSIFAQWCVFEEASKAGLKVMLDGQGADEQLAGYHWGFPYAIAGLMRRGDMLGAMRMLWQRSRLHGASLPDQAMRSLLLLLPNSLSALARRTYQREKRHDWLANSTLSGSADVMENARITRGLKPVQDINTLCRVMTLASNLQMLLHWEDRNAMAHGIEARVPFLDHPLVEFSLALGNAHKMVGAQTKSVLRSAMTGILPEVIRTRQDKLGFATPESAWFRGPLKGALTDAIEATLMRYPDVFHAQGVRALRDDMLEGRKPVDFTLWRIANLGMWGKTFGVTL
jgi:asparagine synthase (glutamine-hydrolysing)